MSDILILSSCKGINWTLAKQRGSMCKGTFKKTRIQQSTIMDYTLFLRTLFIDRVSLPDNIQLYRLACMLLGLPQANTVFSKPHELVIQILGRLYQWDCQPIGRNRWIIFQFSKSVTYCKNVNSHEYFKVAFLKW